ncbi:tetratricopeptide repeat protein [Thiovibrio sp. JS02]
MLLCLCGQAAAFPFRNVEPGATLPTARLSEHRSGTALDLGQSRGRPFIVIFWGADLPEQQERAVSVLKKIESRKSYWDSRQVAMLAVDVLGDEAAVVDEVIRLAGTSLPVYHDREGEAYGRIGVYVIPSLLLVGADGRIVTGLGFSRDLVERLQGETAIMLGEKTRAQVEAALHPAQKEVSLAERNGNLYLHQAQGFMRRGRSEDAFMALERALAANPDLAEAWTELGCLYLDEGRLDKAGEALGHAPAESRSLRASLCAARLTAAQGKAAEAIATVEDLARRNAGEARIHFALGQILEAQQRFSGAADSYRRAYETLRVAGAGKASP